MSKPWFLDVAQDPSAEEMRSKIKGVLGRELNDARSVVERASEQRKELEEGEGVKMDAPDHRSEKDGMKTARADGEGKKANGVKVSVAATASSGEGSEDGLRRLSLTA